MTNTHQARTRCTEILLQHEHTNVDPVNTQTETPLHYAAKSPRNSIEIVQLLYDQNVNILATDSQGGTVLDIAVLHDKDDVAEYVCRRSPALLAARHGMQGLLQMAAMWDARRVTAMVLASGSVDAEQIQWAFLQAGE